MDPLTTEETPRASNLSETELEMAKHGITHTTVDYFHYRQFRYTNLKDALNQARRQENEMP